jgi:hypothetical protein
MKRFFFILVITLIMFPLQAARVYINTDRNVVYIVVTPSVGSNVQDDRIYDGPYGVNSRFGRYTGRGVNRYYRAESFMNNSGTGAHGPGTY